MGKAAVKTPREHGFWVMLFIALTSGVVLGRSVASLALAAVVGCGAILGAMLLGRKIRKNVPLQVGAAVLLGVLLLPVAMAGECESTRSLRAAATLAVVFASTTMSVQAILLRARKRLSEASVSGGLALATALGGLSWATAAPFHAASVGFSAALLIALWLAIRPPSPKRLRWVGMAIASAQLLSACALMTFEVVSI